MGARGGERGRRLHEARGLADQVAILAAECQRVLRVLGGVRVEADLEEVGRQAMQRLREPDAVARPATGVLSPRGASFRFKAARARHSGTPRPTGHLKRAWRKETRVRFVWGKKRSASGLYGAERDPRPV